MKLNAPNTIDTGLPPINVFSIVKDSFGDVLENVNISLLSDPTTGFTTNESGEFSIQGINPFEALIFNYQGTEITLQANQISNEIILDTVASLDGVIINSNKPKTDYLPFVLGGLVLTAIAILSSTNEPKKVTI